MSSFRPQPGPQEAFLSSSADITVYGGAAGGGKTFALLLEPLRHISSVKGFGAVIFRRTSPQIKNIGGLWDTSASVYGALGFVPTQSVARWTEPGTGNTIRFSHLEHDADVYSWQGSQVPLICFDELTHFSERQFFYMLSRNRSTCGVRPYIRATCNPDPDSWVASFIEWWIDQDEGSPTYGLPIAERAGVIRWFVREGGSLVWADSREELVQRFGERSFPKSVTFIPSLLSDNPALLRNDPEYEGQLRAQDPVTRARLLDGNWKSKAVAGTMWRGEWVEVVESAPELKFVVRGWDFAASRPSVNYPDPDYTVGVKVGLGVDGVLYVLDMVELRDIPGEVEKFFIRVAESDGREVVQRIPQDPGGAGKMVASTFMDLVPHLPVVARRDTGNKVHRFKLPSARASNNRVRLVRASWNSKFTRDLEAFPDGKHDDTADAVSAAFEELLQGFDSSDFWAVGA